MVRRTCSGDVPAMRACVLLASLAGGASGCTAIGGVAAERGPNAGSPDAGSPGERAPEPSRGGAPAAVDGDVALVATDLVSVMMQLPALSPFSSTLQLSPPPSPFGRALGDALGNGGYGIQRVSADQGRRYVSYREVNGAGEGGTWRTYTVRVSGIEIERDYTDEEGRLVPTSPVRVLGAVPTPVVVNDDLHRDRVAPGKVFASGVVFRDADGLVLERRARQVRAGTREARASGERVNTERFLVLARANLFHGDRLRAVEDEHEGKRRAMWQVTLRFPSAESLHLGAGNKRALARLRERFDEGADRLSISGCSHGKSLLWDGTESQALARSQRVKEELLLAGVPSGLLREEGCFDTRYGAALPPNAVIVTLERYPGARLRAGRETIGSAG